MTVSVLRPVSQLSATTASRPATGLSPSRRRWACSATWSSPAFSRETTGRQAWRALSWLGRTGIPAFPVPWICTARMVKALPALRKAQHLREIAMGQVQALPRNGEAGTALGTI